MSDDEVWALVASKEVALRRICRRYSNSAEEADEVYSDVVVDRALAILATYDPAKGASPEGHLLRNVKWYAYKWRQRRGRLREQALTAGDSPAHDVDYSQLDARVDVSGALRSLPGGEDGVHACVLRWLIMEEFTESEVAAHLGITTLQVRGLRDEALRLAREGAARR